jgi:5-methylcytosine-specific restriction endonuclease McrA
MRKCYTCKEEKPDEDMLVEKNQCRKCKSAQVRAWQKKNKDKTKQYRKKYAASAKGKETYKKAAQRRRERISVNGKERWSLDEFLRRYAIVLCVECGDAIDLSAPRHAGSKGWERGLQIDHKIAIAEGGTDTLDNLSPTHGLCNLKKG